MKIRLPGDTPINNEQLKHEILKAFPDTKDLTITTDKGCWLISLVTPNKESVIKRVIDRHKPYHINPSEIYLVNPELETKIQTVTPVIEPSPKTPKQHEVKMSNQTQTPEEKEKALKIVEGLTEIASKSALDQVQAKLDVFKKDTQELDQRITSSVNNTIASSQAKMDKTKAQIEADSKALKEKVDSLETRLNNQQKEIEENNTIINGLKALFQSK